MTLKQDITEFCISSGKSTFRFDDIRDIVRYRDFVYAQRIGIIEQFGVYKQAPVWRLKL